MEHEDAETSAVDASLDAPEPPPANRASRAARQSPRPRTPRAAAAAASPTTAAPRPARARPSARAAASGLAPKASAATRSTTSRSAATSRGPRTRTTSAAPPDTRTTAAEALVDIPATSTAKPTPLDQRETADAAGSPVPPPQLPTEAPAGSERAADAAFSDLLGTASPAADGAALELRGLTKRYRGVAAVDGIDLRVPIGSFFGVVGPNGAGKTTTLSMVTGMIRPDAGTVRVYGHELTRDSVAARRALGVLPDRLRLFDRLTGAQLLHYAGALRGLDRATIARRSHDLAVAFGLSSSLGRLVSDYSMGMTKKIAIAAALIHAPRMLVLDEPFESVDPVSASAVLHVLRRFTEAGGTVVLSSHSMELIESTCDAIAIIVGGRILASGPTVQVLAGVTLEDRFVELAGGRSAVEGMEWLHSYAG